MKRAHTSKIVGRVARALGVLLFAHVAFSPLGALSEASTSTERWTARIRENLAYHVIRLARWPDSAFGSNSERISITVFGRRDEGIAKLLQARADFLDANPTRRPHGRGYVVRSRDVSTNSFDLQSLRAAHVVYVPEASEAVLGAVLRAIRGVPVLVIGESKNFASAGGMVGLVLEEGRIRAQIGLSAVEAAGLQISAELLRHAQIVRPIESKP